MMSPPLTRQSLSIPADKALGRRGGREGGRAGGSVWASGGGVVGEGVHRLAHIWSLSKC